MAQSRQLQDVHEDYRRLNACAMFLWYLHPQGVVPPLPNTQNRTPFWTRESSVCGRDTLGEQLRYLNTDRGDKECFVITDIIMSVMENAVVGFGSKALLFADESL